MTTNSRPYVYSKRAYRWGLLSFLFMAFGSIGIALVLGWCIALQPWPAISAALLAVSMFWAASNASDVSNYWRKRERDTIADLRREHAPCDFEDRR